MCQLGYPPGYKLQAEEEGLVLYHSPEEGAPLLGVPTALLGYPPYTPGMSGYNSQ